MVHNDCNEKPNCSCIKNNKCTKKFPKKFNNETKLSDDGYPLYKRRSEKDGGFIHS